MNALTLNNNVLTLAATPAALTPQERAKVEPDYWTAGGQKFEDLASVGDAVLGGTLQVPSEGLRVRQVGWQLERADELKKQAGYTGLATLAALGGTLVAAAANSILVIPGLMLTMVGTGITSGTWQAGQAFATAPQIIEQGTLQAQVPSAGGAPQLVYTNQETGQPVAVPTKQATQP
ncbi:MAG: hypothetical protein FJX76_25680 [Armatimonadetes bacterium]|nr:hypothetical protein [Armatimonadota bacterium]